MTAMERFHHRYFSINRRRRAVVRLFSVSVMTLVFLLLLLVDDVSSQSRFTNKPQRIRREWRTLSDDMRHRVADAMWIMKRIDTFDGRRLYGSKFINYDDLTMLHACSVYDPQCDQGHYGPNFANFHRAYLLAFENSLLAIDPSIEAMPYWNVFRDTPDSDDCYGYDNECYIFSDKYFGDLYGDSSEDYAVTNGLFAYWPVPIYSSEKYGNDSPWGDRSLCMEEEWFDGTRASNCDDYDDIRFLRTSSSICTRYAARNPGEIPRIYGSRDLRGTDEDFDACTSAENIRSYMEWENCVQLEQISCTFELMGLPCEERVENLQGDFPTAPLGDPRDVCDRECDMRGFYYDRDGEKHRPHSLHPQVHILFGGDMFSGTTSPNDASVFTGHHANVDRSHMTWMMNTYDNKDLVENFWGYPADQSDWSIDNDDHINGPFAIADLLGCAGQSWYDGYDYEQPWKLGTLLDDIVNPGFPFTDLWDDHPPANPAGYTHREIIYYSDPSRTIYTYDTLAHLYDYSTPAPATSPPLKSESGSADIDDLDDKEDDGRVSSGSGGQNQDEDEEVVEDGRVGWGRGGRNQEDGDEDEEESKGGSGGFFGSDEFGAITENSAGVEDGAAGQRTIDGDELSAITSSEAGSNPPNAGMVSGILIAVVAIVAGMVVAGLYAYRRPQKQQTFKDNANRRPQKQQTSEDDVDKNKADDDDKSGNLNYDHALVDDSLSLLTGDDAAVGAGCCNIDAYGDDNNSPPHIRHLLPSAMSPQEKQEIEVGDNCQPIIRWKKSSGYDEEETYDSTTSQSHNSTISHASTSIAEPPQPATTPSVSAAGTSIEVNYSSFENKCAADADADAEADTSNPVDPPTPYAKMMNTVRKNGSQDEEEIHQDSTATTSSTSGIAQNQTSSTTLVAANNNNALEVTNSNGASCVNGAAPFSIMSETFNSLFGVGACSGGGGSNERKDKTVTL